VGQNNVYRAFFLTPRRNYVIAENNTKGVRLVHLILSTHTNSSSPSYYDDDNSAVAVVTWYQSFAHFGRGS
jgi:hypothetical protein